MKARRQQAWRAKGERAKEFAAQVREVGAEIVGRASNGAAARQGGRRHALTGSLGGAGVEAARRRRHVSSRLSQPRIRIDVAWV